MSVSVNPSAVEGAEKILTPEEMYRRGLEASIPGPGDAYDVVKAHKWFNLAAMQGYAAALVCRKELMLEMTAEQVAEAQRQAREWLSTRRGTLLANKV